MKYHEIFDGSSTIPPAVWLVLGAWGIGAVLCWIFKSK